MNHIQEDLDEEIPYTAILFRPHSHPELLPASAVFAGHISRQEIWDKNPDVHILDVVHRVGRRGRFIMQGGGLIRPGESLRCFYFRCF